MVLPQALEYNWEFNRSLEKIGDDARQRAMQQRKLEQENREKQYQVFQSVNAASLYPKFEKEVVDQSLGQLNAVMANYIKQNPNASYLDLQMLANNEVGNIAKWSAGVKSMKDNIDKTLSLMDPKSPYDKGRLRALLTDKALYNTDESGNKFLRSDFEGASIDELISQVVAENEDKLIDPFKGEQAMNDVVKDASLYTKNVEQTVETPDGRKTVVVGQKSSVPFFLEAKDGELRVKEQPNGYIDESVFQRFYQDPSIRANINANAKSNMKKIGVPESPEAFEYFKRAYLTTWLEGNKKGVIDLVDKTLYEKPSTGVTVNVGTTQPYRNAYQELVSYVKDKKLSDVSPSISNYLVSIANKSGKRAKANLKYTPSDLDVREVSPGLFKLYGKSNNEEIATLNERDFNQQYNTSEFTAQAGGNASGVNWK